MVASLKASRTGTVSVSRNMSAFLDELPALSGVDARAITELAAQLTLRRVRRGAVMWESGAAGTEVVVVRSGVLRAERATADGRLVTVSYDGRGEVVGLEAVASDARRRERVVVHEDAALLVVAVDALRAWMGRYPNGAAGLLAAALARGVRLTDRLALVSMHGAKPRLAALLLELAARFGVRDSRGTIVDLRLTHRELAALIGATRETVSVVIVELRDAKLVSTESRRVVLLDADGLAEVASGTRR
jgi:CRP/FNR family cyclic AMP-dependent transcriptional regulator